MKPVIGLTCTEEGDKNKINRAYARALERLGGTPFIIPCLEKTELMRDLIKKLSGLILTGGVDVDPYYFGEEPLPGQGKIEPARDKMEIFITQKVLNYNIPVLGICRGMQVLNVAAGGDIYQDINSQLHEPLKHYQEAPGYYPTHNLEITPRTKLSEITQKSSFRVNSFHHQAIRTLPTGFMASAKSNDGLVEVMESENHDFVIAVQYHPELMCPAHEESEKIFEAFVKACG